ncbi:MBL fold metallo-hydrolase [Paenibacillus sp. FSL K6-2524]|uniref:MBL fold metallo-hydrolase n=1 Tax=Paenibacillus sp. FSL K6-2524 TaxID=2954516 RepID=UPI0030FA9E76
MKWILMVLIGMVVIAIMIIKFCSFLGIKPSPEKAKTFHKSQNFRNGKFVNQIPIDTSKSIKGVFAVLWGKISKQPRLRPDHEIPIKSLNERLVNPIEGTTLTWFGHSAFLLVMNGTTILLDPMFGKYSYPIPLFGSKRYNEKLPMEIEQFPHIDVVLISHDHYDHLDELSIKKLKDKVKLFCVPLGVGSHLERWGVDPHQIKEYDWWDEMNMNGIMLAATPAIHTSGRGMSDSNTTLWCSWVIKGKQTKLYFSGDSGYGPHFKQIGRQYGPFDITLMQCGQYDERWATTHMYPEQAIQAHLDVQGKVMIPMHWGTFTLAFHDWTEPIERVLIAARDQGVEISTPRIGEMVRVHAKMYPDSPWWK